MRRTLFRHRGFTLIELLVVVSIITLLIAILLPSLSNAREQGKRSVCLANLHAQCNGLSFYSSENKARFPIRGGYFYNLAEMPAMHSSPPPSASNAPAPATQTLSRVNIGVLYGNKYCGKEGKIFYCPANIMFSYEHPQNGWNTFLYDPNNPNDPFHPYPRSGVVWSGYAYACPVPPGHYPNDDGRLTWRKIDKLSKLASDWGSYSNWILGQVARRKPVYRGKAQALLTDNFISNQSHKKGWNVAFTDFSAQWMSDPTNYIDSLNPTSGPNGMNARFEAWNILSWRKK